MANYSREKIIQMTHLAVYDKNDGEKDKRINGYFLHDFIYKNNMMTRISVITGALILVFFYTLHRIFNQNVDIMTLDYPAEFRQIGLFVLAVAIVYTVISSICAAREYRRSQKRLKDYTKRLNKLGAKPDGAAKKRPDRGAAKAKRGR
jgi:hypothetical protein